ncbi:hypothetical protein XF36_21545 [Pseudonocardia sp. HH130629-09]|nr:hypothetical protein XF36_21545 [Pseudonocardia sp. HH130629-09]
MGQDVIEASDACVGADSFGDRAGHSHRCGGKAVGAGADPARAEVDLSVSVRATSYLHGRPEEIGPVMISV